MKRLLPPLAALLALACSELPAPPDGAMPDAALVAQGLEKDAHGIWRNPDLENRPFADMPIAFREFWRYCFNCHSASGQKAEAREARRALRINTWREALDYGPGRLILSVKGGGMPLASSPPVPAEALDRVQAWLASWGNPDPQPVLLGFRYGEAEHFIRTYCADCHTPAGKNPQRDLASHSILLDTYASWSKRQAAVFQWLDPALSDPMPPPMPPEDYAHQPDSLARARILDWIARLSPNTPDGSGQGTPAAPGSAVRGLAYDTAARVIRRYCADCHTEGGSNSRQWEGWAALKLDTYAQWKDFSAVTMARRLDPDTALGLGLNVMPPGDYPGQPSPEERATLLEWLQRGSPNSGNGQ